MVCYVIVRGLKGGPHYHHPQAHDQAVVVVGVVEGLTLPTGSGRDIANLIMVSHNYREYRHDSLASPHCMWYVHAATVVSSFDLISAYIVMLQQVFSG